MITVPDIRWQRVDIKSVALLPNVLAKQAARDRRAREAWRVDAQGRVTEGASSNAWIVSRDGKLITHPLGRDILAGVTRSVVVDVLKAQGLAFEERAFSVDEAYAAREAFVTSASQIVLPVVSIDGRPIGNGAPGLIAAALRRGLLSLAPLLRGAKRRMQRKSHAEGWATKVSRFRRGQKNGTRPWQPNVRKICKTLSSITSAKQKFR